MTKSIASLFETCGGLGSSSAVKEEVTYRYGKSVTYMTTKGRSLSEDEVHSRIKEAPRVFVHYVIAGKKRLIDCVKIEE